MSEQSYRMRQLEDENSSLKARVSDLESVLDEVSDLLQALQYGCQSTSFNDVLEAIRKVR